MKKALTYWLALNLAFLPIVGAYAEYAASCRSDAKSEEILVTSGCKHMSSAAPVKQEQTDGKSSHSCCDKADQDRHLCLSQCGCDYHAVSMLAPAMATEAMVLKFIFTPVVSPALISQAPALLFEPPRV